MEANTNKQALEALAQARSIAQRREQAHVPPDYALLNKQHRAQKAALTRAINSGDPDKVIVATRKAVQEWNEPGAMWPDDWNRWQHACDDALGGFRNSVDIADLAW